MLEKIKIGIIPIGFIPPNLFEDLLERASGDTVGSFNLLWKQLVLVETIDRKVNTQTEGLEHSAALEWFVR